MNVKVIIVSIFLFTCNYQSFSQKKLFDYSQKSMEQIHKEFTKAIVNTNLEVYFTYVLFFKISIKNGISKTTELYKKETNISKSIIFVLMKL